MYFENFAEGALPQEFAQLVVIDLGGWEMGYGVDNFGFLFVGEGGHFLPEHELNFL